MFMPAVFLCSMYVASALQPSSNSQIVSYPELKGKLPVHRLVIMEALNNKRQATDSRLKTELNRQLTRELLRNTTSPMDTTELALWISALIASKESPFNFNGVDLVADLLHRVNGKTKIHPFLIVTLCNARALRPQHLLMFTDPSYYSYTNTTAMLALSLKALACAATLPNPQFQTSQLRDATERISVTLAGRQKKDGAFGDVYVTSLAIQALAAYSKQLWNENAALDALLKEDEENHTNIVKAYYYSCALNVRRIVFLKDLYSGSYELERKGSEMYINVHLAIRKENSDIEFALTLRVPNTWSLLQIMKKAETVSDSFRFSFSEVGDEQIIYELDGIPNDHEANLQWWICKNGEVYTLSLFPYHNEHIELRYSSDGCLTYQD